MMTSPPDHGFAYDAFLSYASEDRHQARTIAERLKNRAVRVWIDYEQVAPGDHLPEELSGGIARSRSMLVFWSKHYARSKWGHFEKGIHISMAPGAGGRLLVPVLLDDTPIPPELLPHFHVDASAGLSRGDLLNLVRGLLQQVPDPV